VAELSGGICIRSAREAALVGVRFVATGGRLEKIVEDSFAHRFSTGSFANAARVKQSGFGEKRRFIGFSGTP
jgi:hypothetical protein